MSSLAGLVANYGDSDEESEDPGRALARSVPSAPPVTALAAPGYENGGATAGIHPAPIPHCPWSACYDESSGFTYYWNQQTNAVTWEAPAEYLLALKVAQQQLTTARSAEVSAEEWQLYQQALADKQTQSKVTAISAKLSQAKPAPASKEKHEVPEKKDKKYAKRRRTFSDDDDDVKIELITSYSHSDSESNDESESPAKSSKVAPKPQPVKPSIQSQAPKHKKARKHAPVEYGPSLPPNQNYSVPIGPELPPEMMAAAKSPEKVGENKEEGKKTPVNETEDSQDESTLLKRLKDKAKLLEKLGGEIPSELKQMIKEDSKSGTASPASTDKKSLDNLDIDDLLSEIEKKELPKIKSKIGSNTTSATNSPRSTPPREEVKALFPSSKAIVDSNDKPISLFPSAENIKTEEINGVDNEPTKSDTPPALAPSEKTEKKNIYLSDSSEVVATGKKKLRISKTVLPERTKTEVPTYTTKYSTHIEGFSGEHTGLGFSNNDEVEKESPKATVSYGNGLTFTKGEVLNEDRKDEELADLMDLVEAKLKYLHQVQPCIITPVQEMLIQMQTLSGAFSAGALETRWWRRWVQAAGDALAAQEADAAPPGWSCAFQRSTGRYQYKRESDGFVQLEYPAPVTDMDICTTPPHPAPEDPVLPPLPAASPPPPPVPAIPPQRTAPTARVHTPPPPVWHDPPPPGTDDVPPPPPPPTIAKKPPKQEIGDELASFYSEITELEKQTPPLPAEERPPLPATPPLPTTIVHDQPSTTVHNQPSTIVYQQPSTIVHQKPQTTVHHQPSTIVHQKPSTIAHHQSPTISRPSTPQEPEEKKEKEGKKKKSKVKISSSVGMKHKSVSNLVAKWQQVAEEINSD